MNRVLLVAALFAANAYAERPADYAAGVPIIPGGSEPFQRVAVPAAVYEGVARPGLADLRIFNAEGDVVPFAWLPRPAAVLERPSAVALPQFPLYVDRDRRDDVAGLALHVVRDAAGTTIDIKSADPASVATQELGGYVLDTTALSLPLNALVFELPASGGPATMRLRIDASDDLASWREVVFDATLVNLEYAGRRLVRNRIDLPATKAKYLRLSWAVGRPFIGFTAVNGQYADRVVEAPRQWREAAGTPVAEHPGEFEYDIGGAFPVDQVDVSLAEANSIVPAQILARASDTEPWQPVASTVFYRLREPGGDVASAPVPVAGGERRYWLLRFDPRAGATAVAAPPLRAAWQPAELVFAARGSPPFMLGYGNRVATAGSLPIATLVPGYDGAMGLPASVGNARAGTSIALGGPERLREPADVKRWMLWASLALGAVVLGWMAWRLSRELGDAPAPGATESRPE